ncbi:MAG: hypothetical protein ABDI20_05795 [Candidatus Bipolaricaulaceae bacterium]
MRTRVLVALTLFVSCGLSAWEFEILSRTSLTPTAWTEALTLAARHEPWNIQTDAEFGGTGLVIFSLGGGFHQGPLSLTAALRFTQAGFARASLGAGLQLAPAFGLGGEVVLDPQGFAGATLSFWYEAATEAASSGFAGVFEFGRTGTAVGQTLRLGMRFPPLAFHSAAWFGEHGFSSLELGAEIQGPWGSLGVTSGWDGRGLQSLGGRLGGAWECARVSFEASLFPAGDWRLAGTLELDEKLVVQGEANQTGEARFWAIEGAVSLEAFEAGGRVENAAGSLRYGGHLILQLGSFTGELRGRIGPEPPWELTLTARFRR